MKIRTKSYLMLKWINRYQFCVRISIQRLSFSTSRIFCRAILLNTSKKQGRYTYLLKCCYIWEPSLYVHACKIKYSIFKTLCELKHKSDLDFNLKSICFLHLIENSTIYILQEHLIIVILFFLKKNYFWLVLLDLLEIKKIQK